MHAAVRIPLQEFGDRGIRAQRMQQFDLRVGQFDEHDRHAVVGLGLRDGNACAQPLAIGPGGRFEIRDGDGDVVQFSDHTCPRLWGRAADQGRRVRRDEPLNAAVHVRESGRSPA